MVRRTAGSTPPTSPTVGTLVADLPAPGDTLTNTGLAPSTLYSYAVFTHDQVPNYSSAVTISAITGLPSAVHVSGRLTASQTWSHSAASAYIIDSTVTVPAGIKLTVDGGTGLSTCYEFMRSGELRSIEIGGSRRISATALTEYVTTLESEAA